MRQRPSSPTTRFSVTSQKPTPLDGYPQRIPMWEAVKRLGSATWAELLTELRRLGYERPYGAPLNEDYCRKELVDMTRRGFMQRDD